MKKNWKARAASVALSVIMTVTMVPVSAFGAAQETAPAVDTKAATEEAAQAIRELGSYLESAKGDPENIQDVIDLELPGEELQVPPEAGRDMSIEDISSAQPVGASSYASGSPMAAAEEQAARPAGEGTEASPYEIASAGELHWFADLVNGALADVPQNDSAWAKLTGDVDMTGDTAPWTPIGQQGSYKGTFDGASHSIVGLTAETEDETMGMGLFGENGGTIRDLTVDQALIRCGDITKDNADADAALPVSGVIARINTGTIINCRVENAQVTTPYGAGAVAGVNSGLIQDTSVGQAAVTGIEFVGGITGSNNPGGQLVHNTSLATVKGESSVGGIAGCNGADGSMVAVIEDSDFYGYAEASPCELDDTAQPQTGTLCGGIAGYNYGEIKNCDTNHDPEEEPVSAPAESAAQDVHVAGFCSVGGIAGDNYGSISGCFSYVNVKGLPWAQAGEADYYVPAYIGGIAGTNRSVYVTENGTVYTGRVAGCSNNGQVFTGDPLRFTDTEGKDVYGDGAGIGGIAGGNYGAVIEGCVNNGMVKGYREVGGIAGYVTDVVRTEGQAAINSVVTDCLNAAKLEEQAAVLAVAGAGGIAGAVIGPDNRIESCVNLGALCTLDDGAGGIAGVNTGHITGCTNGSDGSEEIDVSRFAGLVVGQELAGGVAGLNICQGVLEDCVSYNSVVQLSDPVPEGALPGFVMPDYELTSATGMLAGGIAGVNGASMTGCRTEGTVAVMGKYLTGGVAGANFGVMTSCSTGGGTVVTGTGAVGGIAGYNGKDPAACGLEELEDPDQMTYIPEEWPALMDGCDDYASVYAERGYLAGGVAGFNDGTVRKGYINAATVSASCYAGGIAGANGDGGVIEKSGVFDVSVRVQDDDDPQADPLTWEEVDAFAGGVAGANLGLVTDSDTDTVRVSGDQIVGGVTGWNAGSVAACRSSADVWADSSAGGIVGYNAPNGSGDGETETGGYPTEITGCVNAGTVRLRSEKSDVTRWFFGGIAGASSAAISDCINDGTVSVQSGVSAVGGITGTNQALTDQVSAVVLDCENNGSVSGTNYVGGVAGMQINGAIERSSNTGSVTASSYAGGIVGYIDANDTTLVDSCRNDSAVSVTWGCAGGIAGSAQTVYSGVEYGTVQITNCYNVGLVTANEHMGFTETTGAILGGVSGAEDSVAAVSNCFYLDVLADRGVFDEDNDLSGAFAMDYDAFMNGQVAWLLQYGVQDPQQLVWGQRLEDEYGEDGQLELERDTWPVLTSQPERRVVSVQWIADGQGVNQQYANAGELLPYCYIPKDGCWLDGWYMDEEMTEKWDEAAGLVPETDYLGLYGRWVPYQYGDADLSGDVGVKDAITILKSVVGATELDAQQQILADVDGDGEILTADAILILKKVVEAIDRFPVEGDEPAPPEKRDPATITVYSTNDIHGVVEGSADDGIIGLPLVAGVKASTENAILLDGGDATQGASFATVGSGAHVIDVMNAAGYDAMAAGNHEFDYGADVLLKNAAAAQFPILSANVKRNGEALLDPSTIIERAGFKIGVIGITTASTATSTNPEKLEGITFEDEIASTKAEIAKIKDQVDAIILVTHLGDNETATDVTSKALLEGLDTEELSMIAAVIDGHSHTVENETYMSIPIIQTGTQNKKLGRVTIAFNENGNFGAEGTVLDRDAVSAIALSEEGRAAQETAQEVLNQCVEDMDPILAEEVARTGAPVWGGYIYFNYAEPRIVETTMGDLVTDAFKYYGEKFRANNGLDQPVIGLENGGGISATLPYGIVTRGDILNAFNHGNTVDVMEVTPAQLYAALEAGVSTITGQDESGLLTRSKESGSFLQVSGLTYTYDPAGETDSKVTSVVLEDGTALSRDDTSTKLLVATNNYVTTFAGLKEGTKLGELGGEDSIVQDYVLYLTNDGKDTLTIDRPAGRIQIADDKSPETYEVVIPVKAADGSDYDFTGTEFEVVVDNDAQDIRKVTCEADGLHLTVTKGAHTFYLTESSDNVPVYTNNYSGSGTVTTADGYYHLYFTVDPAGLN